MITFGSLFSGIGGLDLGLERAGMQCKWQVEIDEFCQKVLTKHWPDVPKYRDIRECGDNLQPVDLICGGFPCQPFSLAKHGVKSKMQDLSPQFINVIKRSRPKYVIAENVSKEPIRRCETELQAFGYRTGILCVSAAMFGGWHKRNRWFVIAHSDLCCEFQGPINAETPVLQGLDDCFWNQQNYSRAIRVHDGVTDRIHRLRSLGNAVVPQVAEFIGRVIVNADTLHRR